MEKPTGQLLCWSPKTTPQEIDSALQILSEDYLIRREFQEGGLRLRFEKCEREDECQVKRSKSEIFIRYGALSNALRAVGSVLSSIVEEGEDYREKMDFDRFGIMLDCSRNAVPKTDYLKSLLRKLALLGFNTAMLYTEDTYRIPGEAYFGYLRGAYGEGDLKDLDDYAHTLGIELVACIQTLGHLEQALKWPAYNGLKDTERVLMVDLPETYDLIEKMLSFWSEVFRSRGIHLGMDETFGLGRGAFLDRYGYQSGYEIFNRHLTKVVELCKDRGLRPMIWSDMFFRLGSKAHDYYDPMCDVPREVAGNIPGEVRLVYWDYYHESPQFYIDWIERHRKMEKEPVMASGVWTWDGVWYDHARTQRSAVACVEGCRRSGLEEIFFTLWGDDGAYRDFGSSLAGLVFVAEEAFSSKKHPSVLQSKTEAICGLDYKGLCRISRLNEGIKPSCVLWDDPLLGVYLNYLRVHQEGDLAAAEERYRAVAEELIGVEEPLLLHGRLLAEALYSKVMLHRNLARNYPSRDVSGLNKTIEQCIECGRSMKSLSDSYRRLWLSFYKPFGLEVVQIRMGGQVARLQELETRLRELLDGGIQQIEELEEALYDVPDVHPGSHLYRQVATTSSIL